MTEPLGRELDRPAAIVRAALYVFVFSIPFDIPKNPLPVELSTITACGLLLATALHPSVCYRKIPGALWWLAAYVFVSALAFGFNGGRHLPEVRNLLLLLVQLVWILWAAYNLLQDEGIARATAWTYVIACVGRAVLQLGHVAASMSEGSTGAPRVTTLGQNPDFIAGYLALGIIIAIDLMARHEASWGRRLLLGLVVAFLATAMMETGSRGAIVALAAGGLAYGAARVSVAFRLREAVAGVLLLGLVGALALSSDTMRHRFTLSAEGNLAGREHIYPELLHMYLEKPVLGWGPITNKYELALRLNERDRWLQIFRREGVSINLGQDPRWLKRDAHNVFLEVMTSAGTLGLLVFGVGVSLSLYAAWVARRGVRGALPFGALGLVLTFNLSENRVVGKIEWLTMAYALASAAALVDPSARRSTRPTPVLATER
jgi:O-antigen ligase